MPYLTPKEVDKSIAFTFQTLSKSVKYYSQIEKEMIY